MARNPRIKWNIGTFQKIRRMDRVDAMLQDVVDGIMDDVDDVDGYKGAVGSGKTRSRGTVWTAEFGAILDNEQNQSLLRALAKARVGG